MPEVAEIGGNETLSSIAEIIAEKCQGWHDEFDQKFWQGKDSFHNSEHIRAVSKATDPLIKAALEGNDPLGILDDLEEWNKDHPKAQIKKEELSLVVKIAIAVHDLGNIAKGVKFSQNGEVAGLGYLNSYKTKEAEDRSIAIAGKCLKGFELDSRFLTIVENLIKESEFQSKDQALFGAFVRVADQIGNDLFSGDKNRVVGLLREMVSENPEAVFVPDAFFNFSRRRFAVLIPDEETRKAVLAIWEKELPAEIPDLEKGEVKTKNWLFEKKLNL